MSSTPQVIVIMPHTATFFDLLGPLQQHNIFILLQSINESAFATFKFLI